MELINIAMSDPESGKILGVVIAKILIIDFSSTSGRRIRGNSHINARNATSADFEKMAQNHANSFWWWAILSDIFFFAMVRGNSRLWEYCLLLKVWVLLPLPCH